MSDVSELAEAQTAVDDATPYRARLQWVSPELRGERRWMTARYACDDLDDPTVALVVERLQLVADAATEAMRPWLRVAFAALPFAQAFRGVYEGAFCAPELRAAAEASEAVGGDRLAVPLRRLADLWSAAERLRDRLPLAQGPDDVRRLVLDVLEALATVDPAAEALTPDFFDI